MTQNRMIDGWTLAGAAAFVCLLLMTTIAYADDSTGATNDESVQYLSNIRQVTFEGLRSGEGYFSADGSKMIFQSERDPANPFYQIFVLDLNTGNTTPVSPGMGKTTCAWIHPDGVHALFASTHEDPKSLALQKEELEHRAAGTTKRYSWDYDEHYEIYATKIGSKEYTNLTKTRGYDAEGSYSPDGKWIAFSSNRHAYSENLSKTDRHILANDAKYFLDIYIMKSDGSDVKRLTNVAGYDGGPFFSPDSKRICWRRFTPDGNVAEIWTMNIDGSDQKQLTNLGGMSWAPYYHPSGDYLIFTTDINGRSNFELYVVDVEGKHEPVRVSNLPGFDGLPVFFPDGKRLAWTANRTENKKGQIFFADFDDAAARKALSMSPLQKQDSAKGADVAQTDHGQSTQSGSENPNSLRDRALTLLNKTDGHRWNTVNPGQYGHVELETDPYLKNGSFFQFALGQTEGTNQSLVHVLYDWEVPDAEFDSTKFEAEFSGLLKLAEYLSNAPTEQNTRTLLLHIMINVPEAKRQDLFNSILKAVGGKLAASVDVRGLRSPSGRFTIEGVGTSPRWSKLIERLNIAFGLPLKTNNTPLPNSWAYRAYEKNVPAISISPDQPQGEATDQANGEVNQRAIQLIARMLGSLMADPDAPPFTPITERADAAKGRPYLGTEPDYRAQVEGVLLKGVKEDGPAHLGGMRSGDVIVQIADTPITNVQGYADALDKLSAGETILVVVMRDGERVLLRVTVGEREQ
ncbi:MAG: PDZ domain-containing protein [Phycisphaerae bacterium]|nr:PD40 domain-containing protein [Phycisphaerales bacterium]